MAISREHPPSPVSPRSVEEIERIIFQAGREEIEISDLTGIDPFIPQGIALEELNDQRGLYIRSISENISPQEFLLFLENRETKVELVGEPQLERGRNSYLAYTLRITVSDPQDPSREVTLAVECAYLIENNTLLGTDVRYVVADEEGRRRLEIRFSKRVDLLGMFAVADEKGFYIAPSHFAPLSARITPDEIKERIVAMAPSPLHPSDYQLRVRRALLEWDGKIDYHITDLGGGKAVDSKGEEISNPFRSQLEWTMKALKNLLSTSPQISYGEGGFVADYHPLSNDGLRGGWMTERYQAGGVGLEWYGSGKDRSFSFKVGLPESLRHLELNFNAHEARIAVIKTLLARLEQYKKDLEFLYKLEPKYAEGFEEPEVEVSKSAKDALAKLDKEYRELCGRIDSVLGVTREEVDENLFQQRLAAQQERLRKLKEILESISFRDLNSMVRYELGQLLEEAGWYLTPPEKCPSLGEGLDSRCCVPAKASSILDEVEQELKKHGIQVSSESGQSKD